MNYYAFEYIWENHDRFRIGLHTYKFEGTSALHRLRSSKLDLNMLNAFRFSWTYQKNDKTIKKWAWTLGSGTPAMECSPVQISLWTTFKTKNQSSNHMSRPSIINKYFSCKRYAKITPHVDSNNNEWNSWAVFLKSKAVTLRNIAPRDGSFICCVSTTADSISRKSCFSFATATFVKICSTRCRISHTL